MKILDLIKDVPFLVVVCDPESYETAECTGETMVETWKQLHWFDPADAPEEEVEEFVEYANDPANWYDTNTPHDYLVWDVGGESSGTISFYRRTHEQKGASNER